MCSVAFFFLALEPAPREAARPASGNILRTPPAVPEPDNTAAIKETLRKQVYRAHPGETALENEKRVQALEAVYSELLSEVSDWTDADQEKKQRVQSALREGDFGKAVLLLDAWKRDTGTESDAKRKEHARLAMASGTASLLRMNPDAAYQEFLDAVSDDPSRWEYQNGCGLAARQSGDPDRAIEHFEKGLAIIKVGGLSRPGEAALLNNLGSAWLAKGDPAKAAECHSRALGIYEARYGREHASVASTLTSLSSAWQARGEPDKAIPCLMRALEIDEKAHGKEYAAVALELNDLGALWFSRGDPDKALGYWSRALKACEKTFGQDHPVVAIVLNNLGGAMRAKGEKVAAVEFLARALAIDEKTYGERTVHAARDLNNLGVACKDMGDLDKAVEYYGRAKDIMLSVLGPDNSLTKRVAANLAAAAAARDAAK